MRNKTNGTSGRQRKSQREIVRKRAQADSDAFNRAYGTPRKSAKKK